MSPGLGAKEKQSSEVGTGYQQSLLGGSEQRSMLLGRLGLLEGGLCCSQAAGLALVPVGKLSSWLP